MPKRARPDEMPKLTFGQAKDAIEGFTLGTNHKDYQMAILVVMGHGDGLSFNLSGGNLDEAWIVDCFSSSNCRSLAGKPKMIIFNTCR